jgi:hypothetical protein
MALSKGEKGLVPRVKRYFFDASIHTWIESRLVRSANDTDIWIDLVGEGVDGKQLLIEIKTRSRAKKPVDKVTAHRDAVHKAVGQLLDYATAYMEQYQLSIVRLRHSLHGTVSTLN